MSEVVGVFTLSFDVITESGSLLLLFFGLLMLGGCGCCGVFDGHDERAD